MRDLRVRFGLILAVAMLPLLIFAIWQSFYDFNQDKTARESQLAFSAQRAVFEIIDTIDTAKSVILTVEETVGRQGCKTNLQDILNQFPQFDDFIIADPRGNFICAARDLDSKRQAFEIVKQLTPQQSYYSEVRVAYDADSDYSSRLLLAYGQYQGEQLQRVLIIGLILDRLAQRADLSQIGKDAKLYMINSEGIILFGDDGLARQMEANWIRETRASGEYQTEFTDETGGKRSLVIIPSREKDIFVAVTAPASNIFRWSVLNPLSSILLPLFAWVFGFLAIWWSTERLILTHIRKLQRATLKFAEGDQTQRVGKLQNPPASIRTLGWTIDYMADEISARESELKDSLDEKETLLREIHHRVKNNLQIIISLLNIQERKVADPAGLAAVNETRNRINAIALVHRGLYESTDLRYVDMQTFLGRLVKELSVALACERKGIEVSVDATCDPMEADTAIPVALFVVETLTNSVKHGIAKGGQVKIRLVQQGIRVTVEVSDNGNGIIGEMKAGTGQKLIKGFARQLGGTVEPMTDIDGYGTRLVFDIRPV
ncbi:sensor histidine kinase [Robiginitomaculum antarcticum]|uniref:sensor histidine kinase n=1 Tax=Robiginitomaculum antarcticum TaxID=437507 RepID=UPI00146156D0|nr:histidine kinase dimerization/phosphoacceptor domain -containing protein [Robiginitomaculum antarcticum]